jgi:hypothetical protein
MTTGWIAMFQYPKETTIFGRFRKEKVAGILNVLQILRRTFVCRHVTGDLSIHPSTYVSIYLSIHLSIYLPMVVQPFIGPWPLFQFIDFYTVGKTPWTGGQQVARPLSSRRTPQPQNKRTQRSICQAGFEPMIPVPERTKTVHVSDRAAGHCDRH